MKALTKNWKVFIILAVLGLGHGLRYFGYFIHPTLYAEEGTFLLSGWIQHRWDFMTFSTTGYLNLWASGIIGLVSLFTITYLPTIVSVIAVLLALFSFSYFLLPHWEKLLSFKLRLFVVVFFLWFSPFSEGVATLEFGFWYFGIGVAFLTLEWLYLPENSLSHRAVKCLYVFVGGLSGPAPFQMALPLLAIYLAGRGFKRDAFRKFLNPLAVTIFVAGAIQILFSRGHTRPFPPIDRWLQFPQASLHQLHMRFVVPTLFSDRVAYQINSSASYTTLSLFLSGLVLSMLFFQKKSKEPQPCWTLFPASMISAWFVYLGRQEVFDAYRNKLYALPFDNTRYTFSSAFLFFLALVFVFSRLETEKLRRRFALALLPMIFVSGLFNYESEFSGDVHWKDTAGQIIEYKKGARDHVYRRGHPAGWFIRLDRPKSR